MVGETLSDFPLVSMVLLLASSEFGSMIFTDLYLLLGLGGGRLGVGVVRGETSSLSLLLCGRALTGFRGGAGLEVGGADALPSVVTGDDKVWVGPPFSTPVLLGVAVVGFVGVASRVLRDMPLAGLGGGLLGGDSPPPWREERVEEGVWPPLGLAPSP